MNETLHGVWTATVAAAPDAAALIDASTGSTHSRAALAEAARAWQQTHGGAIAGQRVVVAEANGLEWLRVFFGLLAADAVIVPLDPGEPPAVQRAIANAIAAPWLWAGGRLEPVAPRRRPGRGSARLIKLTSGSTGVPRALAFTDAQLLADGRQVCASMGIRPDDVNLGLIPFGHSYGLGNLVLPLVLQGTAIVSGVTAMPHAIAAAVERGRPTVFPAVPALLRALAMTELPREALRPLRMIISAGAPLPPDVAQAFQARFALPIHSFYGSSETGGITFDRTGDAALTGRSVGTPLDGVRIHFRRGGRFVVESPAVHTIGNRHRAADGCGRHSPADVASWNKHGELVLQGRAGRYVKIAGRRLNLAEVEHALKRVAGVRDALVTAHAERADALAAAVASDQPAENIRAALREQLASWKIPKKILVLPVFPVTARGKTDARQLRAMLGAS